MEKTRQHSALGVVGWAGFAAYATVLLSALGIAWSAVSNSADVAASPLVPLFCLSSIIVAVIAIFNAFHSGKARWGRASYFTRENTPYRFGLVIVANLLIILGFGFAFLIVTGSIS